MDRSNEPGSTPETGALPASDQSRHFDTCETRFFEQGDAAHPQAPAERFDDLEDPSRAKRRVPSRQFLLGVVVGGACVTILGCVALWRGNHPSPKPAVATLAPPPQPAPAPPAPVAPAVAPTAPTEAPPSASSPPPVPEPSPSGLAAAEAEPNEQPAVPTPDPAARRADCEKAIRSKRARQIVRACADAFAADPSAADLAVAVAKSEFDRGHGLQALTWGKKAIAADPNVADAYVFIGGAEQNAGHGKAAKEAYQRYLELAPRGRYAADLRAIVGRL